MIDSDDIRRAENNAEDWPACLFVAFVWVAMCSLCIAVIVRYGSDVPRADDWSFVKQLASSELPSLSWIWSPQSGHYLPMQKLVMWATWQSTGGNLRAGMLSGFLPLALVAGILPLIARSVRRRMEYSDAFFPLILLSFTHMVVFLWFTTMSVPWSTAFGCLLMASFLLPSFYKSAVRVFGMGICLLLLAIQGATGFVAAVPLGFCFLAMAFFRWRSLGDCRSPKTWILAGFGLAAMLYAVFYVITLSGNQIQEGGSFRADEVAATSVEYLTMSLGSVGKRLWPLSGAIIVVLILVTSALLVSVWWRGGPRCRLKALMMSAALASPVAVSLAVGVGRRFQGGLLSRYSLYAAPLLCCIYLVWTAFPPKRLGHFVQMCLFAFVCASSLYHVSEGLRLGKDRRERTEAFHGDIATGVPLAALVAGHGPYWGQNEESFRSGLELLRQAGIEPFVNIAADPPMQELSLDLKPDRIQEMTQDNGIWEANGRDSQLVFLLPDVEHVYAVRFDYTLQCKRGSTVFRIAWERAGVEDPFRKTAAKEILVNFHTEKKRRPETQTVWIDEEVRQLAISPGAEPCLFELHRITILVPPADGP